LRLVVETFFERALGILFAEEEVDASESPSSTSAYARISRSCSRRRGSSLRSRLECAAVAWPPYVSWSRALMPTNDLRVVATAAAVRIGRWYWVSVSKACSFMPTESTRGKKARFVVKYFAAP
jgi:hypothetical protein